jgi:hypothetical protein
MNFELCKTVLNFLMVLLLVSLSLQAQQASEPDREKLQQQLKDLQERVAQLERAISGRTPVAQPEAVAPARSNAAVVQEVAAAPTAERSAATEPFAFADWSWLNGTPRTKKPAMNSAFFTPEIRADVDYIYDFNHPTDNTVGGSSEVFRANEFQLTQFGVGGTSITTTSEHGL